MYDFHCSYIKDSYGKKASLLFTDTDSLVYEIKTNDAYKDFYRKNIYFILVDVPIIQSFTIPQMNTKLVKSKMKLKVFPLLRFVDKKQRCTHS